MAIACTTFIGGQYHHVYSYLISSAEQTTSVNNQALTTGLKIPGSWKSHATTAVPVLFRVGEDQRARSYTAFGLEESSQIAESDD